LKDIKTEFVATGVKRIADAYREGVKRRKFSDWTHNTVLRACIRRRVHGFGDCDLVIEAVLEKIEVKRLAFSELVDRLRNDCIIASNTSAIPMMS